MNGAGEQQVGLLARLHFLPVTDDQRGRGKINECESPEADGFVFQDHFFLLNLNKFFSFGYM